MMKLSSTVLIFLSTGLSTIAQEDTTAMLLDEVIITAERKAEKMLVIPYSTETVSKTNIEDYQSRTTPEALTGVNGVFVQKTNHGGGSPFLRGLTGNQTLLLVDGIRLNNSTFRYGPNQYLNIVDVYSVNRIDRKSGTGSVQYGTDALGGVVQVFSNEPQVGNEVPAWHARATGKYMSGGMEKTARG